MSAIFLSASIPVTDRGLFHETSNPFLIQIAVRELIIAVIRQHRLVWGGHPSITPMVWTICQDLNVDYSERVLLYQSRHYEDRFPKENAWFKNVLLTPDVDKDPVRSTEAMRVEMIAREDLVGAVFVGGMEGMLAEYDLFRQHHPQAPYVLVAAAGGAARMLAEREAREDPLLWTMDFARLFRTRLPEGRWAPTTRRSPSP